MHWIENTLGLSPDGGSGATELAISVVVALVLALAVTAMKRRSSRWRAK
jgi:hypothetical protein